MGVTLAVVRRIASCNPCEGFFVFYFLMNRVEIFGHSRASTVGLDVPE